MKEAYVCPNCVEAELVAQPGSNWLSCPGCGRYFDKDDMAEHYGPQESEESQRDREIRACFYEDMHKPRASGGGDDGLAMTFDFAYVDDSIVYVGEEKTKVVVLRVRGLDCSTKEAQEAIMALIRKELLLDGPAPEIE